MTASDDTPPEGLSASEKLKRALAMKKAKAAGPSNGSGAPSMRHTEKVKASQAAALAKPAFRKASKRG